MMKTKQKGFSWVGLLLALVTAAVTLTVGWQLCFANDASASVKSTKSAYAQSQSTFAEDEASVTVTKTGTTSGVASLDRGAYASDDTVYLKWKGATSGNNLVVPVSVTFNNTKYSASQLIDISKIQTLNTEYKRLMNESATMTEYDTLKNFLLQEHTVSLGKRGVGTEVKIEFATVAPVYRLYNKITSEHLFSTAKSEYDNFVTLCKKNKDFWIGEGIDWLAPTSNTGTSTVHRLYNAALGAMGRSSHYYSANTTEINNLIKKYGWKDDGASYRFKSGGDAAIYTCYNEALGSAHHYTASKTEWEGLAKHGWDLEKSKNGSKGVFQCLMATNYANGINNSKNYAAYTVIHQQETTSGSYTTVEKQVLSGKVGNNTAAKANSYPGFTAQYFSQAKIANTNNTTVTIKYARNLYKTTYEGVGCEIDTPAGGGKYGTVITKPTDPSVEGYTFGGWYWDSACQKAVNFGTDTVPTSDFVLYAKMDRIKCTVSFDVNGHGTKPADQSINYGDVATSPDLSEAGWTFVGWYKDQACSDGNEWKFTTPVKENMTLYAKWTAGDAKYTVNHYQEGLDGKYPETPTATETLTGVAGMKTDAKAKTADNTGGWAGFTSEAFENKTISDNDDTVIDIYYKRNTYEVTFNVGEGFEGATIDKTSDKVKYGATFAMPNATYEGYHFTTGEEWTQKVGTEDLPWDFDTYGMPAYNLELTANWQPNTDTVYTVKHIFADTENKYDTAGQTEWDEECHGTTAQVTNVVAKTAADDPRFAGFSADTSKKIENKEISRLGDTVVSVYYKRNTIKIKFNAGNATNPGQKTALYGATITNPDTSETIKSGYSIEGWYTNEEYTSSKWIFSDDPVTEQTVPSTVLAGDFTLYAKWAPNVYTIKYVATDNGEAYTGNMQDQPIEYDSHPELTDNQFVREGYTFTGWKRKTNTGYQEDLSAYLQITTGGKYEIKSDFTEVAGEVVELHPIWKENTYTVNFDPGEGTGTATPQEIKYDQSTPLNSISTTSIARPGYHLDKWVVLDASGAETSTYYHDGDEVKNLADGEKVKSVTLKALWETDTYTIKYDAGKDASVAGSMTDRVVKYEDFANDSNVKLDASEFEKEGYHFDKWEVSDTDPKKTYSDEQAIRDVIDPTKHSDGDEIKLVATFAGNPYKVVFKAGYEPEPAQSMESQDLVYGDKKKPLSANTYTRDGYTFRNWIDDKGNEYDDAQEVQNLTTEENGEFTLTAQWDPIDVTIIFNRNTPAGASGNTGGNNPNQVVPYETATQLDQNQYFVEGYTFLGWAETENEVAGETLIADREAIFVSDYASLETIDNYKAKRLYARWTENGAYSVSFDTNGKSNITPTTLYKNTGDTVEEPAELQPNDANKGYHIEGWYTDNGTFENQWIFGASGNKIENTNVVLYAKWEANTYTVKYATTDPLVTGQMEDQEFVYGVEQALRTNEFVKEGYSFKGWSDSPYAQKEDSTKYKTLGKVKNLTDENEGVVTLYPVFSDANTYKVGFLPGDGSDKTVNSYVQDGNFKYGEKKALEAVRFKAAKGYSFDCWKYDANGTVLYFKDKEQVSNLTTEDGATVYLTAQWNQISYKVRYNRNGADSGVIADETHKFAEEFKFLSDKDEKFTFKKTGYHLSAWTHDNGDGTITSYDPATMSNVSKLCDEEGAVYELNAQWELNSYNILFDPGDGTAGATAAKRTIPAKYDENVDLTNYTTLANTSTSAGGYNFVKAGYHVVGWKLSETQEYAGNASVKNLTEDNGVTVILSAIWEANNYTVQYKKDLVSGKENEETEGSMDEQKFVYDEDSNLCQNKFTRSGYVFAGWKKDGDNSSKVYGETESVRNLTNTNNGVVVMRPVWKAQTYTITYNSNYKGTATNVDYTPANTEYDYDVAKALTTFNASTFGYSVELGYSFNGWNTAADGTGKTYKDGEKVSKLTTGDNVVLYAMWAPNTYTIKFVNWGSTDGSSAPSAISGNAPTALAATFGTSTTLRSNAFSMTGYSPDADKPWKIIYNDEASNTKVEQAFALSDFAVNTELLSKFGSSVESTKTITLYSNWKKNTWTLSYETGSNATMTGERSQSVEYGARVSDENAKTIAANDHYEFEGWYTDNGTFKNAWTFDTGSGTGTTMPDNDVTLYAKIVEDEYHVRFSTNGDSGLGTGDYDQTFKWSESKALDAVQFVKSGYHCIGWSTSSDAETVDYEPGALVSKLSDEKYTKVGDVETGVVTLYPVWEINTYTIKFDPGQHSSSSAELMSDITDVKWGQEVTLPELKYVANDSYKFLNWSYNGATFLDKATVSNLTSENGAVVVLTAMWGKDTTYYIHFNANNEAASGKIVDQEFSNNPEDELYKQRLADGETFSLVGWTFKYWTETQEDTGTTYEKGAGYSNSAVTAGTIINLYAQWSANTYTVKYYASEEDQKAGNASYTTPTALAYNEDVDLSADGKNMSKTGYHISSWKCGSNTYGEGQTGVSGLTSLDGGTVELVAVWEANTYTIHYDKSDANATGSMSDQKATNGKKFKLSANTYLKTGYHFKHWEDASDATKTYDDEAEIAADESLVTDDKTEVTLKAVWEANTYTITYYQNANDSDTTLWTGTTKYTYDDSAKALDARPSTFVKSGYHFVYWTTNRNGSGDQYKDKADVKNLTEKNGEAVALYAQWSRDEIKVKFDTSESGVTGTMSDVTLRYDVASLTLPANTLKKAGYAFEKWQVKDKEVYFEDEQKITDVSGLFNYADDDTLTLVPVWQEATVTVKFLPGNGGSGETEDQVFVCDKATAIKTSDFTKERCHVSGWTRSDGGANIEGANASLTFSASDNGKVLTLTALWDDNKYSLVCEPNSALDSSGSAASNYEPATTYTYTGEVNLADITSHVINTLGWNRSGKELNGWKVTTNGTTTTYPNDEVVSGLSPCEKDGETATLTAVWSAKSYKIKFEDGNGATLKDGASATSVKSIDDSFPDNPYHLIGYRLTGWKDKSTNTVYSLEYSDENYVQKLDDYMFENNIKEVTLVAQWESLGNYWLGGYNAQYPEERVHTDSEKAYNQSVIDAMLSSFKKSDGTVTLDDIKNWERYVLYVVTDPGATNLENKYTEFEITVETTTTETETSFNKITLQATHALISQQVMGTAATTTWATSSLKTFLDTKFSVLSGLAADTDYGKFFVPAHGTTVKAWRRDGTSPAGETAASAWYRDVASGNNFYTSEGTNTTDVATASHAVIPCFEIR